MSSAATYSARAASVYRHHICASAKYGYQRGRIRTTELKRLLDHLSISGVEPIENCRNLLDAYTHANSAGSAIVILTVASGAELQQCAGLLDVLPLLVTPDAALSVPRGAVKSGQLRPGALPFGSGGGVSASADGAGLSGSLDPRVSGPSPAGRSPLTPHAPSTSFSQVGDCAPSGEISGGDLEKLNYRVSSVQGKLDAILMLASQSRGDMTALLAQARASMLGSVLHALHDAAEHVRELSAATTTEVSSEAAMESTLSPRI